MGQAESGRIDPLRPDEVRHLLAEIACRNVAGGRIIPFGRQVDILRLIRKQARIALAAGAPAYPETLVDSPPALQAGIVVAGNRVTIRRPEFTFPVGPRWERL